MSKEYKLSIRIAGNTLVPCLSVLVSKGYSIDHYFLGENENDFTRPQWDVEKDGLRFSATTAEELLGLVAMWEARGDDWHLDDKEFEFYENLVRIAKVYNSNGVEIQSTE